MEDQEISTGLGGLLRRISEKEAIAKRLEADAKEIKDEVDALKEKAMEMMGLEGISTVKCDGRLFYITKTRNISIPLENREEVIKLAKARGWEVETVNSMKLKSLLAGEQDGEDVGPNVPSLVQGTEFDGLILEHRALQLRSRGS